MMRSGGLPGGLATPTLAVGLTLLRVVTGFVIFIHGYQKLVVDGLTETEELFFANDFPYPEITAPIVTYLEFGGGLLLMIGLLTQLVALLLFVDMLAAIVLIHSGNGFFAVDNGIEVALLLGGVTLGLTLTGPGAYSVDNMLTGSRPGLRRAT